MRMAQGGQLRGRVSEEQLIDVLDQVRFHPYPPVWWLIANFGEA